MIRKQAIYAIEYNNNIYIGETGNIENRIRVHKRHQLVGFELLEIKERPQFRILMELTDDITRQERCRIEKQYSDDFRKQGKNVINNPKLTQETKLKISKANKGRKRPQFSKEWCRKLSEGHKGKKHSIETRQKISQTHKNRIYGNKI